MMSTSSNGGGTGGNKQPYEKNYSTSDPHIERRKDFRELLNEWVQRTGNTIRFENTDLPPRHAPTWCTTVYINGVVAGTGMGSSINRAHEAASYWALYSYGQLPPSTMPPNM